MNKRLNKQRAAVTLALGLIAAGVSSYLPQSPESVDNTVEVYSIADPTIVQIAVEPQMFYRSIQTIKLDSTEFNCLARNIYYEAGIEEFVSKVAVAQVTNNRVKHGTWGRSFCSVVHARKQFSWTLDRAKKAAQPSGPLWQESVRAAKEFVAGLRVNGLSTSMHYHADYVKPNWASEEHLVAQLGTHLFYDLPTSSKK